MCVWRGLLAAVAVSCTLSRIHGQPTQRLDRIKDLVCVLVLSGMQKEDLDVNMLNKLQRYNVNIEDLNNAELLQHCITISSTNESSTYVQPSTTETSIVDNFNIDTFSYKSRNEKATELKEDSTNKDTIQYINGQPALQSVLKFWQDMKLNKSSIAKPELVDDDRTINESHLIYEQKNKRNVANSLNLNETDIINKIFAHYLSRRNNENTTHDITSEKGDDIGSYLKKLPIYNQNHNYRTSDLNNIPTPNQLRLTNTHQKNVPKTEDNEHIHKTELLELLPQNTSKMYNMISAFNAFKTFYPFITKANIIREKLNTEEETNLNPSHVTEMILATTEKTIETTFPKNVIKEIAQSVKDMILKELRKEIMETTTKSIAITTTKSTTTPRVQETAKTQTNEESIMNKFLDLFNEIKLLKEPTLTIRNAYKLESKESKTKTITEKVRPIQWQSKIVTQMDSKDPISSNFGVKTSNQNSRMILKFSPQEHKFRSNGIAKSLKQARIRPAGPITVQTNNMEIAPLAIPVDEPQNPINQNIIVTTMVPYRIDENKAEVNRPNPEPGIALEEYIPKNIHYLPKIFNDQPQYYSHSPQSYLDRIPNLDDGHLKHSINYKAKVDPIIYSNSESNHVPYRVKPPIPRFHEKLENIYPILPENKEYPDRSDCCNPKYAYSKQMTDCCNHVSSRQQLSLGNVKQPQYDDTHFKNFLKSQKKVTDMLERILASRNRIPSVETA